MMFHLLDGEYPFQFNMMQAIITIPALSHIDYRLMHAIMQSGLPMQPLFGMSDLPRARSLLLTMALERQAERILLVDSDIVPTPEQLMELATTDEVTPNQAVTGLYAVKGRNAWAVNTADTKMAESGQDFKAGWAGLGFACVHRESLLRVANVLPVIADDEIKWSPFCVPMVIGNTYYPDDRVLWFRLANAGVSLKAISHLKVGHVSAEVLTEPQE